jgi:hypothetical protein
MSIRATEAQRRALLRLPLTEKDIARDTRRRGLWGRLVRIGFAEWCLGVLVRTSGGYCACATTKQDYEDRVSDEMEKGEIERAERSAIASV